MLLSARRLSTCRVFCFFFQAEDGIRDKLVTGVQTCALPISISAGGPGGADGADRASRDMQRAEDRQPRWHARQVKGGGAVHAAPPPAAHYYARLPARGGGAPPAMSMPRRPIEVAPRVLWRDRRTVARGHGERCRHDLVHPDQLPRDDHAEALCDADGHPRRRTVLLGLDHGVAWELQDTGRHVGQPATELMPRGLRAGGRGECQTTR